MPCRIRKGGWLGQVRLGLYDEFIVGKLAWLANLQWTNLVRQTGIGKLALGKRS